MLRSFLNKDPYHYEEVDGVKNASTLWTLTNLWTLNNETQRGSTFSILFGFQDCKYHLQLLGVDKIATPLANAVKCRKRDTLIEKIKELNPNTRALQRYFIIITDVEHLFYDSIIMIPQTRSKVSSAADIVDSPQLEFALYKFQDHILACAHDDEGETDKWFLKEMLLVEVEDDKCGSSLAERSLKNVYFLEQEMIRDTLTQVFKRQHLNNLGSCFRFQHIALPTVVRVPVPPDSKSSSSHFNKELWNASDIHQAIKTNNDSWYSD